MTDQDAPDQGTPPPAEPAAPGKRALRPPVDAEEATPETEAAPEPKRSTVRRITFWTGLGLILAGLGLLVYVAWQLWGTNWVSKRHQRAELSQLQEDWAAGEGCDTFCPHGKASAIIRIPKFGKNYAIPIFEGTSQDILAKGFGHFDETAAAGQVGNYAIAGHRVTHGEPLRHMPDLRPGDEVIVETRKFTYTYVLDTNPNDLVISFTGTWVLDSFPHNPASKDLKVNPNPKYKRLITLTTCSEIFHTDNRMIAFGHLVRQVKKTIPVNQ